MGAHDFGTQEISFDYRQSAQSISFNRLMHNLVYPGIYTWENKDSDAEPLARVSDTLVEVAPMTFYVKDSGSDDNAVRVQTSIAFELEVAVGTPYVVWRFDWTSALSNFADCLAVDYASLTSTDVIITRCIFTGASVLIGFDYSRQSLQKVDNPTNFFDQVHLVGTEGITNKFELVNDLTFNTHAGRITLTAQTLSTGAGAGGGLQNVADGYERKDIVWVDFDYTAKTATMEVTEGSEVASSAVAPEYGDKFVLGEVYRIADLGTDVTVVTGRDITLNKLNQMDIQPITEGSALVYYQSAAPTHAPDGTVLGAGDEGRKWVDSDTLYEYVWDGSAWQRLLNGVSGGVENNLISIDADGRSKDSGTTDPNQDLRTTAKPSFAGVTLTAESTSQTIVPDGDSTRDLGSTGVRYANVYGDNIYSSSSRKKKKDITHYPDIALNLINGTEIVEYRYKNKTRFKVGFIAEETSEILAENHCQMDITNTIGILMKAVQELSTEVEVLKGKLNNG